MNDKVSVLRKDSASSLARSAEPLVARVSACDDNGIRVEMGSNAFVIALMTTEVARIPADELVGRDVLVLFDGGDRDRPIAVSVLQSLPRISPEGDEAEDSPPVRAFVDDEDELVINAKKKIRLQCGEGSITITEDGKIVLRGTHLLSRSSGPVRIKGGHVDIN